MKIKVLIEGYAKEVNGIEYATCSTVLIQDGINNIIVDPGSNRDLLIERLNKEGININDINIVMLTHNHIDHSLLAGMFSNAVIYDDSSKYFMDSKIEEHNSLIGDNIEIISTPGHDQFHMSVLVKNTELGNVLISGDIFWWKDDDIQNTDYDSLINLNDPYVKNIDNLINSRKKVLKVANYIIPGHGKPFVLTNNN